MHACSGVGAKQDSHAVKLTMSHYKTTCGALQAWLGACRGNLQSSSDVRAIGRHTWHATIVATLARRTDIEAYSCPQQWELLSAARDAALDGLPEMAVPPGKLMQTLMGAGGDNGDLLVAGLRRPCHRGHMTLREGWLAWSSQGLSTHTCPTDSQACSGKLCIVAAAEPGVVMSSPPWPPRRKPQRPRAAAQTIIGAMPPRRGGALLCWWPRRKAGATMHMGCSRVEPLPMRSCWLWKTTVLPGVHGRRLRWLR